VTGDADLAGRIAVVTGAGSGMGRATALLLAERGAAVMVNDLGAESATATAAAIRERGGQAEASPGDVSRAAVARGLVAEAQRRFERLDILVNNAGMVRNSGLEAISEEEWDLVLDVNLKSAFICSQAAIPALKASGRGRIVNVSSSAGKSTSTLGGAHYTAAKAGLLGLTRHFARELGPFKVTVNAVCPGLMDTPLTRAFTDEPARRRYAQSFPLRRLGTEEDEAELVCFLCSDRAAYITGASVDINGGDLMI
jgi:NAD(P)-dependent dehydrogenase (short-subunit alcohol dehydrogenase family)